jgi:hypothetical protein
MKHLNLLQIHFTRSGFQLHDGSTLNPSTLSDEIDSGRLWKRDADLWQPEGQGSGPGGIQKEPFGSEAATAAHLVAPNLFAPN